MFTRQFWMLTAERAVKTFAQALAAVLVASGTGLLSADWKSALSTAGMATVVSVLTSVASCRFGPNDSPSVVDGDPATPPRPSPTSSVEPAAPGAPAAATAA